MESQTVTTTDWWTVIIAAYAAIVATGALFLEVRRWFESGPRLAIQVKPEMELVEEREGHDDDLYLLANVTNRGNAATTITHFWLADYGSLIRRIRSKPKWTAIVKPGVAWSQVPYTLKPGDVWTGLARHNDDTRGRMEGRWLYVMIRASHADKPLSKRVRPPKHEIAAQQAEVDAD
jgi:hypothetical protein